MSMIREAVEHELIGSYPMMWIFLPALVAVILLFSGWFRGGGISGRPPYGGHPKMPDPRRILDERYAKGEIGKDEYEQIRRDLGE